MSIVLIGNGSSVLDKEMGGRIDGFDRVVRFNSYKIKGFEKFVGSRTTDWFNVQFFEKNDERLLKEYKKYVFHSWSWHKRDEKYFSMEKNIKAEDKSIVEESVVHEMASFCGDFSYKWFSTGAIAAWLYLKSYNQIHLYGFDWWNREKHHYADNQIRGDIHKPQKEFAFFQKLGNGIIFL